MPPFRLKIVLELRQREYEAAVNAWSRAKQALAILDQRIQEREAAAGSADESVRTILAGGTVDLETVFGHGRDAILARAEAAHYASQHARIVRAVEQAYQVILTTRTKVAALEKLQQRHADAWQLDQAQREMASLDEAILRAASVPARPSEASITTNPRSAE